MERYTKSYLQLIKPGITLSNTMTAVAGYLFAAGPSRFQFSTFFAVAGGVALVIASACVANNILDKDLDSKMKRTRNREIAKGKISSISALFYACLLGLSGFAVLFLGTNNLTTILGVIAFVWYVVIYGAAKRTTPLSTIIGAFCGALPPVAGYTAVTNQIDGISFILFGLLFVWQLPHFYAISVFRRDEYKKAGLPVWSLRHGIASTRAQIMFWICVFLLPVCLLALLNDVSTFYIAILLPSAFYWIFDGAFTYRKLSQEAWARRTFFVSLVVLILLSVSLSINSFLA